MEAFAYVLQRCEREKQKDRDRWEGGEEGGERGREGTTQQTACLSSSVLSSTTRVTLMIPTAEGI